MKKINYLILFLWIFFSGCGNDIDSSPPLVFVTYPLDSSSVAEAILIGGSAVDNDSIKSVELWIDSLATGFFDSVAPYEFIWNTTSYLDSSLHYISLLAEDRSNNKNTSESVVVIVNNSFSNPKSLEIKSISYSKTIMEILFNPTVETDFKNYELLYSESFDGNKVSLGLFTDVNDTLIQISNFDPASQSWYWLKVTDLYGYSTIGPGYYVLDSNPEPINLEAINFNDGLFKISWSSSNESDFESYSVYESLDQNMIMDSKIYEFTDININEVEHSLIQLNQYYYYQVRVKDYWGLSSMSNISKGASWYLFNNTYSQPSHDYGRSILETSDGGYIVVGNTSSMGNSYSNLLLLKVSQSGEEQWNHNLTFSPIDRANSVLEIPNNGYVIVGNTISPQDESQDLFVLKINQIGHVEWSKSFGSSEDQQGHSIQTTIDDGFIICGYSREENTGFNMLYLIKIDSQGNQIWDSVYGSNGNDYGYSLVTLDDGSFAVAGMTSSYGDINGDAWLIKIDFDGNEFWSQTYGGTGTDVVRSVALTNDNGFIMVGNTNSYGNGNNDVFVIKVDENGIQQWSQTYGGIGTDIGRSIAKVSNGGYIITGYTDSFGNGGSFNAWLIGIDATGNILWDKTFGGDGDDRALSGLQTLDGGYVLTGYSNSNSNNTPDVLIIKTDNQGEIN
tara:strand:- start:422 stop:2446 length:2025 start_codon:yes stop_codon:yes gene_type:complete